MVISVAPCFFSTFLADKTNLSVKRMRLYRSQGTVPCLYYITLLRCSMGIISALSDLSNSGKPHF
jgi:hypothetical protein